MGNLIDDFDMDDSENTQRDVDLAETKMVIGQHVCLLAERLMLNMKVGRKIDELHCIADIVETLSQYGAVLQDSEALTSAQLKSTLSKVYDKNVLVTPEELEKQIREIRAQGEVAINDDEDGFN